MKILKKYMSYYSHSSFFWLQIFEIWVYKGFLDRRFLLTLINGTGRGVGKNLLISVMNEKRDINFNTDTQS